LDVLVNNVQATPPHPVLWAGTPFWELPTQLWDDLLDVGLRSHFVASARAVPVMMAGGRGLIINVASSYAANAKTPGDDAIVSYSVAKAGLHRLTSDMAVDLDGTGISVVEVWPRATRTESAVAAQEFYGDVLSRFLEPVVNGRILAALIAAGNWPARHGQALDLRPLADELGVPLGITP